MDLVVLAEAIRSFPGLTRKRAISGVLDYLPVPDGETVIASAGEDAAVIKHDGGLLLFAADGIMESLMHSNPFYAGYYAVLVNLNDIAAMGGTPIAMVDILSVKDDLVCAQVIKGIKHAVEKFGVPVVGGHTHPDCQYHAVDVAILGVAAEGQVIFSHTAEPGDDILFIMDLEGFYPPDLPYAWDTTTNRTPEMARRQLQLLPKIAQRGLVHSGKDMSNPGCIGTLGMLLETSGKGGWVDVSRIPSPDGVDLTQWFLSYQGFGFVLTCSEGSSNELLAMFAEVGGTGAVVGKIDDSCHLELRNGDERETLFDFRKDVITGCTPRFVPKKV